ncbi:Ig-like domain-containing protein [Leptolyngbya sp. FACHB-16]|uniref:Ig-like domain-containing protein n=1 Tax=unclassified Leptolyngbya TaxID=2650499 RepID=UPI0016824CB4|nr:Ig-like domain-containing protein [Leptolyngbya sp. FACHB-16]MBD2153421.1 cadherin-like domain-containing protein [Leptolyngbya sp. FACHB-16]
MSTPIFQGSEFQVNSYTTDSQAAARIAMDAAGNFIVTWQGMGQSDFGIYGQRYDSMGNVLGDEVLMTLYPPESRYFIHSTALDATGNVVLTWERFFQPEFDNGIYAQRYDSTTSTTGGEFPVYTNIMNYQGDPQVVVDANGNFVVTWTGSDSSDSDFGVFAQRYSSDGTTLGSFFRVNSETSGYQGSSHVAMDADGNFVVTWEDARQNTNVNPGDIYAQRYSSTGIALGEAFQVNTSTASLQEAPRIAMDADGDFIVTWHSDGQDGSGLGIYAQRFSRDGVALGNEFRVNTYTTDTQSDPQVAMDADGDFVITWQSNGQDGDGLGVYAQVFNKLGNRVGEEFRANTFTTYSQYRPQIAMDADGDFVITWEGYGQNGSGINIYAQRFSLTNDPPAANADSPTVAAYGQVVIDVLANDSNPSGDPLQLSIVTDPMNGTVTVNDNGTAANLHDDFLVYTPTPGYAGADSFTYQIDDGKGGIDTAEVSVTVTGRSAIGTAGSDTLNGSLGDDTLNGAGGNDVLNGLAGRDRLVGGLGGDRLFGGAGNDTLIGGSGGDTYGFRSSRSFRSTDFGGDTIVGFATGTDRISLSANAFQLLANSVGSNLKVNQFATVSTNAAAATASAAVVYNTSNGQLFYNTNGTAAGFGTGGALAILQNAPTLNRMDVLVV